MAGGVAVDVEPMALVTVLPHPAEAGRDQQLVSPVELSRCHDDVDVLTDAWCVDALRIGADGVADPGAIQRDKRLPDATHAAASAEERSMSRVSRSTPGVARRSVSKPPTTEATMTRGSSSAGATSTEERTTNPNKAAPE